MSDFIYNIFYHILHEIHPNSHILFILINTFHPLDFFSHLIKKKNIQLSILIQSNKDQKKIISSMKNHIKDEECCSYLSIYNDICEINNKKIIFDRIIIIDFITYDFLEELLSFFFQYIDKQSQLYIYCSLSNEKEEEIKRKNKIREKINQYTNYSVGNVFYLYRVLDIIKKKLYDTVSLRVYKKNNYIVYGTNYIYEIQIILL